MHRTFVAIIGAAIMSAALVSAQDKSTSSSSSAKAKEDKGVTFVGCLGPGTGSENFTLTKAEEKGTKDKSAPATFKVVPANEKVKLGDHVLQSVTITGTFGDAPAAAGAASNNGETLRTFTVTSVKWQADYCGLPF